MAACGAPRRKFPCRIFRHRRRGVRGRDGRTSLRFPFRYTRWAASPRLPAGAAAVAKHAPVSYDRTRKGILRRAPPQSRAYGTSRNDYGTSHGPVVSCPVIPVEAPILHSFSNVLGRYRFGVAEIGDGTGDFQNTVVRARGEAHAIDGHFQGALAGFVEGALFADQTRRHARIVIAALML